MESLSQRRRDVLRDAGLMDPPAPSWSHAGLYKAQFVGQLNGQTTYNVLHMTFVEGLGPEAIVEIAADLAVAWDTNLNPHLSNQFSIGQVIMTDMTVSPNVVYPVTITPPITGGNTSSDPTPFIALSARKLCTTGGRASRGFMRIAGLVGAQFTAGELTDTAHTQFQNDMNNFFDAVTALGATLVVASFYAGGAPRSVPQLSTMLGFDVSAKVTTQNSRKLGRGI